MLLSIGAFDAFMLVARTSFQLLVAGVAATAWQPVAAHFFKLVALYTLLFLVHWRSVKHAGTAGKVSHRNALNLPPAFAPLAAC